MPKVTGVGEPIRSRVLTRAFAGTLVVSFVTLGLAAVPAFGAPAPATTTTSAPTTTTLPSATTTTNPATALPPPPTDLAKGIAQATQLQTRIAANSTRADVLDEKYLKTRDAVTAANKKIDATQRQITATEAEVAKLHERLAGRAALLYMGAGNNDPIGLDATSVTDLGSMAQYGDAAASQDQRILDDLKSTEAKLTSQHHDLDSQLAAAKGRRDKADAARREVARINADMQKMLDNTQASVKLLAAQMEQEALASASLAEQTWLQRLAAREAAARAKPGAGGKTADPGADIGDVIGNVPAPNPGALLAIAYAEAQLGKPYVYAGAGPDVFDCSGLTMMAWKQAGVAMNHGSQSQYDSFLHIPIDQLQPGDLVFFGVNGPANHHVGIVVGPGIMIDAPHTGAFVEIVSYYRADLVPMGARP